ncbi:histone H1/5, partial [Lecanoromycetidae sp. Uapishka_2]
MPPKKATTSAPAKKSASAPAQHSSYRDMIKEAIMALKERNGSSRSALKKYILANNKNVSPGATFDGQFNRAIKTGVEKEEFAQPKGPSGTVKLHKPAAKPAAEKKPAAKKTTTTKKPAAKAAAPKKATATKTGSKAKPAKKATATKAKAPASKAKAPAKSKANTGAKRTKKTPTVAPAIVEEKLVLGKTKSGRVTKGPAKSTNPASKKSTKVTKPASEKKKASSTPKKSATQKAKTATPAAA